MKNPFQHQDLDVKNELIALARDFRSKDIKEDIAPHLAAALLYANLADYLAANLLCGLQEISEEATREYLNGRIVIRQARKLDMPLEKTIKGLKEFEFPSRDKVLELLADIRKNRNKVAHEIFKTPGEQLPVVGQAVTSICEKTEELVDVVNAIYRDMPPRTIVDVIDEASSKQEIVEDIKMSKK